MRDIVYWKSKRRLVYLDEEATPKFWDTRWKSQGRPQPSGPQDYVITVTKRFLPRGSRILEGGCGQATKVKALYDGGYVVTGIDFAPETVARARTDFPMLNVLQGDVRKLDFEDGTFDGYWSLGVIEHFWSGYDDILSEAARVVRPNGFLFLTAPWLSPYRKRKADSGGYPEHDFIHAPDRFYQFALQREEVSEALFKHGFRLLEWRGLAPDISMKEDMVGLKEQLEWLLSPGGSIPKKVVRRIVLHFLGPYCGHAFLAVARKSER